MRYDGDHTRYESFTLYSKDIKKLNPLNKKQLQDATERIKDRDEEALEKLINANLKYVVSIAKQYLNRGLSIGELISAGNEGLILAAKRYDIEKGSFTTYAKWWITQKILYELRTQVNTVRLPDHHHDRIVQLNRLARHQEKELGDNLFEEDGTEIYLDPDVLRAYRKAYSLDAPFEDGEDNNLYNILASGIEPPDQQLYDNVLSEEIENALSTLEEREAEVLRDYFGLNNSEEQTLEEIGIGLGLTKERARQIKENALQKLRHPSRSNCLKSYYED